ncbi:MAG: hypothetical protein E7366_05905, partial [Clostridiales bacterium]|nr:hypothetical protein [Clostridiales bacterium]
MSNISLHSLCADGVFQKLWKAASSTYAIFIYVGIIAVIVVALIITAMKNEGKNTQIVVNAQSQTNTLSSVSTVSAATAPNGKKTEEEDDEDEGRSRFYMLCEIDANSAQYQRASYDESITLKRFCEEFRNFACHDLHLYYSIDDIRRFIAGLTVTKIMILQGMSGTGKTSLAYAFGEFLENKSTVVPVQPMWKERTDL